MAPGSQFRMEWTATRLMIFRPNRSRDLVRNKPALRYNPSLLSGLNSACRLANMNTSVTTQPAQRVSVCERNNINVCQPFDA